MYSQYWSTTGGLDYRRYTVVEGDLPLPLDSTCPRKRLRSPDKEDQEEAGRSRPSPEGSPSAGERSRNEEEQVDEEVEEEVQRLCQRCHIMASQLHRQAVTLADRTALKDPTYASFLLHKLQRLQWQRGGRRASVDARCHTCSASFHHLRRRALLCALRVSRDMTPRPAPTSPAPTGPAPPLAPQGGGAQWAWGDVQSIYLGGGGAKGLATVTPLPLSSAPHLEGVWRVSCRHQDSASAGGHMTARTVTPDLKPAAHSIATQTGRTPSTAAAFLLRAAQKLSLSRKRKPLSGPPGEAPGPTLLYSGGFSGALQLAPPPVPPCLLRVRSKMKDVPGRGKVRVMVRVSASSDSASVLKVDTRRKQLTLCPASSFAPPPKTFTFDSVFSQDASQAEVCSGTVADVVQSVVNGADGCVFCYGHANLGKTYTMIGRECSTHSLGVAPTAVSWLFQVMEEHRHKSGARFSVDVSAVEISGQEEELTDLLAELASSHGGQQEVPIRGVSLQEDLLCGSQLQNQTELCAVTAERAAFFLDVAVAARRRLRPLSDQEARWNSHFLFTLHLHQERAERSSKASVSGRSRLHLLDLGSCETDVSRTREGGGARCLPLSALGNVILALANGAQHVPYRDSKLTMLLRESLGNINCRTTMIAHVCASPTSFLETLTTLQLAARVHRTAHRPSKQSSGSSGGDSSCKEAPPTLLRPFQRCPMALEPGAPPLPHPDPDYSSSSEHSCDTVIYTGPGGGAMSDWELSDSEAPPPSIPIIPSLNRKPPRPKSDGNHLKCNTFAELQDRLDCIDGHEGTGREAQTSLQTVSGRNPDQDPLRVQSRDTKADWDPLSASVSQACARSSWYPEPVLRERFLLRNGAPEWSASLPWTTCLSQPALSRVLPVDMSQPPQRDTDGDAPTGRTEARSPRVACLGSLDLDHLRTTVTLQQPVELNQEDQLVFTLIEELPRSFVPGNGRPCTLLGFTHLQASDPQPISIISSINDEYDASTSRLGTLGPGKETDLSPHHGVLGTSTDRTEHEDVPSRSRTPLTDRHAAGKSPTPQRCDRGDPPTTNTHPTTESPAQAFLRGSLKTRVPPAPPPNHSAHSSLPRTTRSPSSSSASHQDCWPHARRAPDPRDTLEPPSSGKPPKSERTGSVSCKKTSSLSQSPSSAEGLADITRGATTLWPASIPQGSGSRGGQDGAREVGTLRFPSLEKKAGQKSNITSKSRSGTIAPPVRQSSQDPNTRTTSRLRTESCSHRTFKLSSSLKTRGSKADSCHSSPTSAGPKQDAFRESDGAPGGPDRSNRSDGSTPGLGVPASTPASQTSPGLSLLPSKLGPVGGASTKLKVQTLLSSSTRTGPAGQPGGLPPTAKSPCGSGPKTRRGTIMGTKQAFSRSANTCANELATAGPMKQLNRDPTETRGTSGSARCTPLPSPYSKVTAPRRPPRCSSGHGSDGSSVLSGELPPAMGRTALFYHSSGSSGYDSVIRDSETTGSNSSALDSTSESGTTSTNKSRVSKSPRKRGPGFLRRRLIPVPLPDACPVGRKVAGQWVDVPTTGGGPNEPFEIKVYEIDDMKRLQRRTEPTQEVEKRYFEARLKMQERRQRLVEELQKQQERLKEELQETRRLLMVPESRRTPQGHVDQDLDWDSQEYLEALAQVTAELQDYVTLCKSRVMMETCFDISTSTKGGRQEVEV